jgi:uncharacterized membrane protein
MDRRFHPATLLIRLHSTYWFVPSVITVGAGIAAQLLVMLDRGVGENAAWLGWAYNGGADGARALLSSIAGSTITVVSVTFSVLVVALTVSSQHYGPRLLVNLMRDTPAQLVLGTFTGTFAYCLMVLRTVQGDGGDRFAFFVPHLAITGAVALTFLSIAMLIYYVHHVATRMQVAEITAGVVADFERAIERLYPERIGEGPEAPARPIPRVPDGASPVFAPASGYIQEIASAAVLHLAERHSTTVWLARRPGDFVVAGTPIARVYPPPEDWDAFAHELAKAYVIANDRTSRQDAAFAVQQLVEVALRALSPGVNEAFTAITCIDRLGQGLSKLAARKIPSPVRTDDLGRTRVIASPQTFDELASAAFEPIALYAERNPAISGRLLDTLAGLGTIATRADDRRAITRIADLVHALASGHAPGGRHRRQLARKHQHVRSSLWPDAPAANGAEGNTRNQDDDPQHPRDRRHRSSAPRAGHDHDRERERQSAAAP